MIRTDAAMQRSAEGSGRTEGWGPPADRGAAGGTSRSIGTAGATDPVRSVLARLAAAGRGIRWYVTSLMGDSAYATYVAHQRRHHPGEALPTEREFWRQRMDEQDRNPGARCC